MMTAMTVSGAVDPAHSAARRSPSQELGLLARWWRRRSADRRRIDFAVWDLRERYGQAAFGIARVSSRQPIGWAERRFWRKVSARLRRMD